MLTKTEFSFDINLLIPLLADVKWDDKQRCQLNSPTGNWLYDPYVIKDEWRNTAFEDLLKLISKQYMLGEARLIKLSPGTCYLAHTDIDDRIHINIIGNDQSYLIDLDTQKLFRTVADNSVYYMDASHRHVAANFGSYDRVQLVIRISLPRYENQEFSLRKIKFYNLHDRFRYDFDNNVSQIISNFIKRKL